MQLCSGQPSPPSDLHQKNTVHGSFRHGGSVASLLETSAVCRELEDCLWLALDTSGGRSPGRGMMSKPCAGLKRWAPLDGPALPMAPLLNRMAREVSPPCIQAPSYSVVSSHQPHSDLFTFAFSSLAGQTRNSYFQQSLYRESFKHPLFVYLTRASRMEEKVHRKHA